MTRVVCPFSCSTGTDPVHKPHSRVYESRWLALLSYPTTRPAANKTTGEPFGVYSVGEI